MIYRVRENEQIAIEYCKKFKVLPPDIVGLNYIIFCNFLKVK